MSTLHQRFEHLHRPPALFVLPNVWDAGGYAQLNAMFAAST